MCILHKNSVRFLSSAHYAQKQAVKYVHTDKKNSLSLETMVRIEAFSSFFAYYYVI